jgi:hypothetical protein
MRCGVVVVSLVALAVVGFAGEAGAADNPIVGTRRCFITVPGSPPTCTFTGTVNGVPYTGTLDDAYLTVSTSRACNSADPRIGYRDGIYYLGGGLGVFAGVTGYGHYSQTYVSVIGHGAILDTEGFGDQKCGPALPFPAPPIPPPAIASQTLPDATLGQPYAVTLSASDGTPPYKFRVAPKLGKLPRGLKISKTGTIAGIPKRLTGTFVFTILLKDSHRPKQADTQQFSITVH